MSTPVKQIKLSNVLTEIIDKTEEDGKYRVLTSSQSGIVSQEEYFNKKVASRDTSGYKIIRKGQFTYRAMSDTGRFYINRLDDFDIGIVSPAYPVFEIKDNNEVSSDYLTAFFKSEKFQSDIAHMYTGSTRSSLKFKNLRDVVINVPDKEEQKKRLNVLRIIDRELSILGEIENKLDDSVKSRFIEMFGDPEAGEGKYELQKLRDLSVKISDGVHAKPEYTSEGRPFLSVVNINKGVVDFENCKYVSEEAYQKMIKSTCPEKGDVLYTKVGATYGIPAYIDTEREFCLYVSVCLIKPKHEMINSRFLAIQMGMPSIKHQADARIKGIGVPDLHLNQIGEFDIICPPRNMQDDFVSFVDSIDKSKLAVQEMKNKMEILKASVMQEYFC